MATGPAILVGLVLAPYWLGPVMVWLTNRSRLPNWRVSADHGFGGVPSAARSYFETVGAELAECGFTLAAVLNEPGLVPGFGTWVALLVSRARDERAVIMAHLPAKQPSPVKPKPAVYFRTQSADGRVVETGNVRELNVFPRLEGHDACQFPEITDARLLHRVHQLRMSPMGSAARKPIPEGEEIGHLNRAMAEFYASHVKTGYLRVAEPGRSFRPTVKGAVVMTWRLLPPMSWVARGRLRRRNRAFLAAHHVTA